MLGLLRTLDLSSRLGGQRLKMSLAVVTEKLLLGLDSLEYLILSFTPYIMRWNHKADDLLIFLHSNSSQRTCLGPKSLRISHLFKVDNSSACKRRVLCFFLEQLFLEAFSLQVSAKKLFIQSPLYSSTIIFHKNSFDIFRVRYDSQVAANRKENSWLLSV